MLLVSLFFILSMLVLITFSLNKFDKDEMASDSRLALLQRRDEMLLLSERCFTSALGIEDGEAWLHHYILGKISEKLKKPPGVYLEHYQKVNVIRETFKRKQTTQCAKLIPTNGGSCSN